MWTCTVVDQQKKFLEMKSMKFVKPLRTASLYSIWKLLRVFILQIYVSTNKTKKVNIKIKLFTNQKYFHAH